MASGDDLLGFLNRKGKVEASGDIPLGLPVSPLSSGSSQREGPGEVSSRVQTKGISSSDTLPCAQGIYSMFLLK